MDNMRLKFLGTFEVSYELTEEIKQECDYCECALYNVNDDSDWYDLGQFMRHDGMFDGSMCASNSSSIQIKISDDGDYARLWRAY